MPKRRGLLLCLPAALLGFALLGAACSNSPSGGAAVAHLGTTTTTRTAAPNSGNSGNGGSGGKRSDALAYAQCMRAHGVPAFPDPNGQGGFAINGGPGTGLDPGSATFQAAQRTCGKLLPDGGHPTAAQQAQMMAKALKFSACMRSHGITDFPDPQSAPGGGIAIRISAKGGASSDLNPNSPLFQAAQKACQGIMGLPRPGRPAVAVAGGGQFMTQVGPRAGAESGRTARGRLPLRRARLVRTSASATLLASAGLLLAACGGGAPNSVAHLGTTTTVASGRQRCERTGAGPANVGGKLEKYAECMRSHGVGNFPDPEISGASVILRITPAISGNPGSARPGRLSGPAAGCGSRGR